MLCYSELDSSGSIKKLTYGVFLKQKSGETELNKLYCLTNYSSLLWYNSWNILICKSLSIEYQTAWCKFDSCGSHLTVPGHVINVYFLLSGGISTMLTSNKNSCFLQQDILYQIFTLK